MPNISAWKAFDNLVTQIKKIQGSTSGSWHNLGNRVYTRNWLPQQDVAAMPYVCIPLSDTQGSPRNDEGNLIQDIWRARLYGYVPDAASSMLNSQGIENALKLKDDIFDILMKNWTLDGQVQNLAIVSWSIDAGMVGEIQFAELHVDVQFQQYLSDEVFGP